MKFVACCLALMVGSVIGHRRSRSSSSGGSSSDEDFDEYFAFANRGDSSFGYFRRNKEVKTLSIVDIIDMDSEPMYVSNTNPACDPEKDSNIAIGDRANDRILFYDSDLSLVASVDNVCDGIFHSWANSVDQLWVACDVDNTIAVVDTSTFSIIDIINISDVDGFKPHDITSNNGGAFATLLGTEENTTDIGFIIQYDIDTFEEITRIQVGGDPHVYINDNSDYLYVASQKGNTLYKIDAVSGDLAILDSMTINQAHGIVSNDALKYLYVTDITSADGSDSLYVIDLDSFTQINGSPFDSIANNPHNVVIDSDGRRLYVANSGASSVAKYKLKRNGKVKSGSGQLIFQEDGTVPFGIGWICQF